MTQAERLAAARAETLAIYRNTSPEFTEGYVEPSRLALLNHEYDLVRSAAWRAA